jgi:hypothetical protein
MCDSKLLMPNHETQKSAAKTKLGGLQNLMILIYRAGNMTANILQSFAKL